MWTTCVNSGHIQPIQLAGCILPCIVVEDAVHWLTVLPVLKVVQVAVDTCSGIISFAQLVFICAMSGYILDYISKSSKVNILAQYIWTADAEDSMASNFHFICFCCWTYFRQDTTVFQGIIISFYEISGSSKTHL